MTQEEKELLLKDLCTRLPYSAKVNHFGVIKELLWVIPSSENVMVGYDINDYEDSVIEDIKPYLRPMSSMTEEEKKELKELCKEDLSEFAEFICNGHGLSRDGIYMFDKLRELDFLNSHHFDYRGLIEKGLALEAPEGMYKTE